MNGASVVDPSPDSAAWSSVEPEHDLCGSIDHDTTIGPNYAATYVMTCDLTVEEDATLTVEPGAIVKTEDGTNLQVNGTLDAQGAAAEPITFTSVNDNSVGGSTGSGEPEAGDWTGIEVGGSGSVDLEHAEIDYASTGVGGQTSGSVVVKSDHFSSSVPAVAINAPKPTVQNNSAVNGPGPDSPCGGCVMATFNVGSSSLDLGLLGGNTASGSGVGGIEVSGTVVTSTFPGGPLPLVIPDFSGGYGAEPGLDVPSGVTATFAAGTVVKGLGTWAPGPWNGGLTVEGTLDAVGTSGSPITFTSVNDNSVGGSTGSGEPEAGDWTGIEVGGSGSVDLEHAEIDYASTGVGGQTSGSVVVKSDHFSSSVPAVAINAPKPTVQNNSAVNGPGPDSPCGGCVMATFNVGSSSLDLGLLGGNTASGSGVGGIEVSGTVVTSTFPGGPLPLVIPDFSGGYGAEPGLDVPSGVTATFAAGTVVKGLGTWAPGPWNGGLTVEGTLDAVGTSGSPITFTSVNDNSVGGSTGSGEPEAGDWTGIEVGGSGSVDLEHAEIDYASTGVGGQTSGSVVVKSDHFSSSVPAVAINAPKPTVQNNSAVNGPGPDSPCGGCVMATFNVGSSSLDLGLLGGNTASGSGVGGIEVSGTVVTSTFPGGPLPLVIPDFSGGYGAEPGLDVPSGVTATFAAGTVVKGLGTWAPGPWNGGLTVEGTLDAVGTSGSPITFTSVNDNSVGGSTGSGEPEAGDWTGIWASGTESSLDLEHVRVDYAGNAIGFNGEAARLHEVAVAHSSIALSVSKGSLSFRGSLSADGRGIEACSWESGECSVDAAYTYWGSSEGPFPSGQPALACGTVTTSPYRTSESGGSTASGSVFGTENCDGSPTPEQLFTSAQQAANTYLATEQIQCGEGFQDACQAIQLYEQCLGSATTLAQSQSPFPFSDPKDVASTGADWLASSENAVVSDVGQVASFGLGIIGAAKTIIDISNAYSGCG